MSDFLRRIREGMATALETIDDIGQVSAWMLNAPTPPCAHVFPAEVMYDDAMARGHDEYRFTVQVLVSPTTDIGGQQLLDKMLAPAGSSSVKAALENDVTLGGSCFTLRVESSSGYRTFGTDGRGTVLGSEWSVAVWATGI